jgi:hypothetical protein
MSAAFEVESAGRRLPVDLDSRLDPAAVETAEVSANRWIKQLRHARIDDATFRDRFTHRGDSLWWFAELYLHKMRVVSRVHRAILALEHLALSDHGARWFVDGSDHVVGHVAHLVARRHGIACEGPHDRRPVSRGAGAASLKALFHTATAAADRLRPVVPPRSGAPVAVAAFVHSAFVREHAGEEAYVGPVIAEIARRMPASSIRLVGLGPRTNFRVRGWRDRASEFLTPKAPLAAVPVANFAPWRALEPSRAYWRDRASVLAALEASHDLRDASVIGGYDVWPIVVEELRGIAELQFPWSARAMDEAAAALDTLQPSVAVTYAEAGGWGRALMLEARRRGIATIALQHGFIYRHWLNYLHEPDEVAPSPGNPADAGFPRPSRTLLFDEFTREHLESLGHFPSDALAVTGSVRLDAIVAAARAMDAPARDGLRAQLGAGPETPIALVAAKFAQLGRAFTALVEAARAMPDMRLVVKPHPAEGPDPYVAASAGAANVVVAPPGAGLGPLTRVASVLVTVNSTAAIEAMTLGVPALVVGLPNNLSPFVDAGAMAGADKDACIAPALRALLYDREMRQRLGAAQTAFMRRYRIEADGGAARRAADLILSQTRP